MAMTRAFFFISFGVIGETSTGTCRYWSLAVRTASRAGFIAQCARFTFTSFETVTLTTMLFTGWLSTRNPEAAATPSRACASVRAGVCAVHGCRAQAGRMLDDRIILIKEGTRCVRSRLYLCPAPGTPRYPRGGRPVAMAAWREMCDAGLVNTHRPAVAVPRSRNAAQQQLLGSGATWTARLAHVALPY